MIGTQYFTASLSFILYNIGNNERILNGNQSI
jgi:hypothetical protein